MRKKQKCAERSKQQEQRYEQEARQLAQQIQATSLNTIAGHVNAAVQEVEDLVTNQTMGAGLNRTENWVDDSVAAQSLVKSSDSISVASSNHTELPPQSISKKSRSHQGKSSDHSRARSRTQQTQTDRTEFQSIPQQTQTDQTEFQSIPPQTQIDPTSNSK